MKKQAIILALFLALPVCAQNEKAVECFLQKVYNRVEHCANNLCTGDSLLLEEYCSERYKEFYHETRRWETEIIKECLFRFGGGDIWYRTNDYFATAAYKVVNVRKSDSDTKKSYRATIVAEYTDKDIQQIKYDVLVIPDGEGWCIDDFIEDEVPDTELMKESLLEACDLFPPKRESYAESITRIPNAEKEITTHLKNVFNEIEKSHNSSKGCYDEEDFVNRFCSQHFKSIYNEVRYWECKLGEMIWGGSVWGALQDETTVNYSVTPAKKTDDAGCARYSAVVTAKHYIDDTFERSFDLTVYIVSEAGGWRIDDFQQNAAESDGTYMQAELIDVIRHWIKAH